MSVKVEQAMRGLGYVPVRFVAEKLGVAPSTVYGWMRGGHIQTRRSARQWFVELASVRAYVGTEACDAVGLAAPQDGQKEDGDAPTTE